ncbi:MAG: tetraacyldisaccharide 4'-kinase [Chitinispirillales bacterium]|jgi:tetraacyldisaccharide 4'-kinase|nr:tetraacyldisaccharide 4'-kinase [Chitinispirillales bacterium]
MKKNIQFDSPLPAWLAANPFTAALSGVYGGVVSVRNFAYNSLPPLSKKLDRPTISIGNIRAGGTGKTPAAQFIGQYLLNNHNCDVAFLSRGYGRQTSKTVIVRPTEKANWKETGDEPAMIHANLPESWLGIGTNRTAVAKKMSPHLPDRAVFILDDGFQHRRARRDLNIVCLTESTFTDRMIPAGYLREPVSSLARADIAFIIGAEERIEKLREVQVRVEKKSIPICAILLQRPYSWVEARTGAVSEKPPLKKPAAVTGIARPERFFAMLDSFSISPSGIHSFADHHNFKKNDIESIHNIYLDGIVTTEKDAVRLLSPEFAFLREIWYLKIGLRFADSESEARVLSAINSIIP